MGILTAAKCDCGQFMLPPKERCILCMKPTKLCEINDTGNILTFTTLHATPEGFEAPLVLAVIKLEPTNQKQNLDKSNKYPIIVCQGRVPEEELKIGLKVKVEEVEKIYYFTNISDN